MVMRWLRRLEWRRSDAFGIEVEKACGEICAAHGVGALSAARRKARRNNQSIRRQWVWKAVVARLEAERRAQDHEAQAA
ncbi:hypothetical protein L6Q21_09520 [Sandaracinobacter sp. RS1-74]|uniref:hypothetical protein n=1 Tax=Sandaracinobacteroides sayramensis TaxID=2913411 RepID=UPI001EDC0B72|nr:hypothetical protein [Sandaracinobacteroides sayramensis]MCG2841217.1 hypothetical protein [Sandaracinobacteroides sayramensis]